MDFFLYEILRLSFYMLGKSKDTTSLGCIEQAISHRSNAHHDLDAQFVPSQRLAIRKLPMSLSGLINDIRDSIPRHDSQHNTFEYPLPRKEIWEDASRMHSP